MNAPIAYVAHAISAPLDEGPAVWRRHFADVQALAARVAEAGFAPIVPQVLPGLTHRCALYLDHSLVRVAAVLVVHQSRWTADSTGVQRERRWSRELSIPEVASDRLEELADIYRALRAA